jgi:hypothetical protein
VLLLAQVVVKHFEVDLHKFRRLRVRHSGGLGLLPFSFHLVYRRRTKTPFKLARNFGESSDCLLGLFLQFFCFWLLPPSRSSHGTFLGMNEEFSIQDRVIGFEISFLVLRLPLLLLNLLQSDVKIFHLSCKFILFSFVL